MLSTLSRAKITIRFTTNTAVKNDAFPQKLPGSAAVLFRPYTRRGFAPPFTMKKYIQTFMADFCGV